MNVQAVQPFQLRHQLDALLERAGSERVEELDARVAAEFRQMCIEDHAAADGERGRVAANDETIAGHGDDGRLEANLDVRGRSRLQLRRLIDETDAAEEIG